MDKATQATTPTASTPIQPPAPGSFAHAAEVAADVVGSVDPQPFSARIERDYPSGWRIALTFRDDSAHGVYNLGAFLNVPATRAVVQGGVHLEVCTRVQDVEVCAAALVTAAQADQIEGHPGPAGEQPVTPTPVPLDESPLAADGTTPPPADADTPGVEGDMARCARCGCTEDTACEGGCFWVPNPQPIALCSACATPEELAAITYLPAPAETPGGAG